MTDIEPYVKINKDFEINKINNDLIALSIIMMINPFVGKEFYFDFSVSKDSCKLSKKK